MSELTLPISAAQLAAEVGELIDPVYAAIEELAADVIVCCERAGDASTELSLEPLKDRIAAHLAVHPAIAGMGYVASPGTVSGLDRFLFWCQRSGQDLARLRLNLDPTSVDVYDYLQMDWFQNARDIRSRVAFGPYVDYAGSGLYVITASVPIIGSGQFLGVTGCDIVMAQLEPRLVGILRTCQFEALIVGDERRVLAANSSRWLVGSRVPKETWPVTSDALHSADVPGGPGWTVLVTHTPRQFSMRP